MDLQPAKIAIMTMVLIALCIAGISASSAKKARTVAEPATTAATMATAEADTTEATDATDATETATDTEGPTTDRANPNKDPNKDPNMGTEFGINDDDGPGTAEFIKVYGIYETSTSIPSAGEAVQTAYREFFVDHTWDGTLKQIGEHIVSISDDGDFWYDCHTVNMGEYKPPWGGSFYVIKDLSDRMDIYATSSWAPLQIAHYHHGELVDTTDAEVEVDQEALEQLSNQAQLLPLDDLTKERIAAAREAYRDGWDGEYKQLADDLWARVDWHGQVIFNNGESTGYLCLPESAPDSVYLNNIYVNGSMHDDIAYQGLLFLEDGMLYAYSLDDEPLAYELPFSGDMKIVAADFDWYEWPAYVEQDNSRVFAVVIETLCDDGSVRLDLVQGDLDYEHYGLWLETASHCKVETLSLHTRGGAQLVEESIIYSTDGALCVVRGWDNYYTSSYTTKGLYAK